MDYPSKRSLHNAAALWGLSPQALLKLLTNRTIEAGGSRGSRRESALVKPLTTGEATAARDNVARLVYSLLFDFIVGQTNHVLGVEKDKAAEESSSLPTRTLGLLDLFGFESFVRNDIEQLLINLANEALQDMYCKQVLIAESNLYKSEGLRVDDFHFEPNSGEGRTPRTSSLCTVIE